MKKDADIAKLFAAAETHETPKEELLTPAIYELKKIEARKKAQKKTRLKIVTAACACAAVVVVALSVLLPRFMPKKGSAESPAAPAYYSASEITSSGNLSADVKTAFPEFTHINGDAVLPESVSEYKFADGKAAYATLSFRRRGRFGIEDVTVVAEFADGVFEEYKDYYEILRDGFNYVSGYENGEYTGKCAAKKNGVKYYIDVMCAERIDFEYYKTVFEG